MVNCNIRHYFCFKNTFNPGTFAWVSTNSLPVTTSSTADSHSAICFNSVFNTNNSNNLKNSYLNLKVTGMKSRCSTCFWSLLVLFLALCPSLGGTGETMPLQTGEAAKASSTEVTSYLKLKFASISQHLSATDPRHCTWTQTWQLHACSNPCVLHHPEQQGALTL